MGKHFNSEIGSKAQKSWTAASHLELLRKPISFLEIWPNSWAIRMSPSTTRVVLGSNLYFLLMQSDTCTAPQRSNAKRTKKKHLRNISELLSQRRCASDIPSAFKQVSAWTGFLSCSQSLCGFRIVCHKRRDSRLLIFRVSFLSPLWRPWYIFGGEEDRGRKRVCYSSMSNRIQTIVSAAERGGRWERHLH